MKTLPITELQRLLGGETPIKVNAGKLAENALFGEKKMNQLVLSLFPGADLFGMAFEAEGFTVIRGPDILLGGDIRDWHMLEHRVDGIIGGPPCKPFSRAVKGQTPTEGNLVPEFERIVLEARPKWWVMENVKQAPVPLSTLHPSCMQALAWFRVLDAWAFGANQHRERRFSSNLKLEPKSIPDEERCEDPWPTVTATEYKYCGSPRDKRRAGRKVGRQMTLDEMKQAQGLPSSFETPALTKAMSMAVIGNGVELHMGRAIARAVKNALNSR